MKRYVCTEGIEMPVHIAIELFRFTKCACKIIERNTSVFPCDSWHVDVCGDLSESGGRCWMRVCVSQISEAPSAWGWKPHHLHAARSSNRRSAREKSQREGRFQQTMSDFGVDVNVVCVWQRDWQHGYDWPRRRCVRILFSIISHRRRPRRVETVSHTKRRWCSPAHPEEIGRETAARHGKKN